MRPVQNTDTAYKPINCGYYDRLEAWAVTKTRCDVRYRDESGNSMSESALIKDIYSKENAEYLLLETGTIIRLDRLEEINGVPLPLAC